MGSTKPGSHSGYKAAHEAREAWNLGLRAFVFVPHTKFSYPSGKALSVEVDAVMSIGWRLHSTSMTKIRSSNVTMMFTFVRP